MILIHTLAEHKEFIFLVTRYFFEIVLLYFLFRYKYKTTFTELVLDHNLQEKLISDFKPESIVDEEVYKHTVLPSFIGSNLMEVADFDFYNLVNENKVEMVEVLRNYGVGTCGPPGFYGTLDLHIELEHKISHVLGTEASILYSNSFTCINSVITCFCKQYDTVFYHKNCNEGITRALGITKSSTISFNNLENLEMKLQKFYDKKKRNFIITEGLFKNTGEITNIRKLICLKRKYKARIILDESLSIPLLGLKGVSGLYDTDITEIDVVVGSLSHVFCGNGGFATGTKTAVDYQRLSAQSYCFSASLPGFLTMNALKNFERVYKLIDSSFFRENFESESYSIISSEQSPMIVIINNMFIERDDVNPDEEYIKLRRVRDLLIQDGIRIGLIENPVPSLRVCIKENLNKNNVRNLVKSIAKALN